MLGAESATRYRIIIGDPHGVAQLQASAIGDVFQYRDDNDDAPYFNWGLNVTGDHQAPFPATHAAMSALEISRRLQPHELASNLRRVFSGLVAGNVKDDGIAAVEAHGPFQLAGDRQIMQALDELLAGFVQQQRMRLPGSIYHPCYELAS